MQPRLSRHILSKIAAIREIQRHAAEAAAARAASGLRTKIAELKQLEDRQATLEENWLRAATAPSIVVELLGSWSAEMARNRMHVDRASSAVTATARESQRRSAEWSKALSRSNVAAKMTHKAAAFEAAKRDERAVEDALDLFRTERRRSCPAP